MYITPRIEWELRLNSLKTDSEEMLKMVRDRKVHFVEDEKEVYRQLDEVFITANFLQILTNSHQYLCEDDYYVDMADNYDHVD